jgi:hypothetical protein
MRSGPMKEVYCLEAQISCFLLNSLDGVLYCQLLIVICDENKSYITYYAFIQTRDAMRQLLKKEKRNFENDMNFRM